MSDDREAMRARLVARRERDGEARGITRRSIVVHFRVTPTGPMPYVVVSATAKMPGDEAVEILVGDDRMGRVVADEKSEGVGDWEKKS